MPLELTARQKENQKPLAKLCSKRFKRKSLLRRIVTADVSEYDTRTPNEKRSYLDPGRKAKSTARPKRFGKKARLCIFGISVALPGFGF